jgi:hypothetical protein
MDEWDLEPPARLAYAVIFLTFAIALGGMATVVYVLAQWRTHRIGVSLGVTEVCAALIASIAVLLALAR